MGEMSESWSILKGGHETCIGDEWDFSKEKGTNELLVEKAASRERFRSE